MQPAWPMTFPETRLSSTVFRLTWIMATVGPSAAPGPVWVWLWPLAALEPPFLSWVGPERSDPKRPGNPQCELPAVGQEILDSLGSAADQQLCVGHSIWGGWGHLFLEPLCSLAPSGGCKEITVWQFVLALNQKDLQDFCYDIPAVHGRRWRYKRLKNLMKLLHQYLKVWTP